MTRSERAMQMRDAAISIVNACGSWKEARVGEGCLRILSADSGDFRIVYRTPFQKVPRSTGSYEAALIASPNAYGLDVWGKDGKVLNLEWNDDQDIDIRTFKRGDWEQGFLDAAQKQEPLLTRTTLASSDLLERRAPLAASTWNAEARTFEVVFSTGAPVERYDARGAYTEFLAVEGFGGAEGAPFLDHHRRDSLDAVLGVVLKAGQVGGEARATIRLSRHTPLAERLGNELADGNRFGVSVGYTVELWTEKTDPTTGRREKTATKWTVREISVVSVPADRHASTRGSSMTETPAPATEPATPAAAPAPPTPAAADRAAVNAEIRSIGRIAGLDQAWIDSQIDAGATSDAARTAAFEAMRTRTEAAGAIRTPTIAIGEDHADPEARARIIGEAIFARTHPEHQLSEAARPYAYMSLVDIARDCLRQRGISTTALSPLKVIERIGHHSTSDFPLILGDAVGRSLRMAYQAAPSALKRAGRKTTARDFKDKHRLALSEAERLNEVPEGAEFQYSTLSEDRATYRLATYGRIFAITRQALVNDDLGAFDDLSRRLGQASAATEAALLAELVIMSSGLGPNMSDGKKLFHTDHGNLASSGAPPDVTTLSAARTALRKQTGLQGEHISVTPKFLIVPAELETVAEKLMTTLAATKADDVNPFSGHLDILVEPRFADAARWYVAANPAEVDGLEYCYLEGEEGPQVISEAGFDVDGVKIRVRMDFAAAFVDWRSWYMNAGTGGGG